ncbi:hypothetical protein [Cellulomonas sp. NPDC058312]|uniref:hypothetical protein n=1 Tax=Cellulomonas sp. NPDC058312 TaxID=3346441 RepID=UPI0036ECEFAA
MTAGWAAAAPGLVLRRARTQAPLLLAVLATALVALAVLGTGTLLLTAGRQDALSTALGDVDPARSQVVARVVPADGAADPAPLAAAVAGAVEAAATPLPVRTTTWVESPLLRLPAGVGAGGTTGSFAYLVDAPDVAQAGRLVTGRWPATGAVAGGVAEDAAGGDAGAVEVAVPLAAADALGLAVGDVLDLGATADGPPGADPVTAVRVVGAWSPLPGTDGAVWDRDRLRGAGVDLDHDRPGTSGRQRSPAYGPFVLAPGAPSTATGAGAVAVLVRPDAADARPDDLTAVARAVPGLRAQLVRDLGDRADRVVVRSALPDTLSGALRQHEVTGSVVVVGGLVGLALAGAALLLAGRLVATRRSAERDLLRDRGASTRQLLGQQGVEAVVLAVLAAVLAVPVATVGYGLVVRVPALAAAGLRPVGPGDAGSALPAVVGAGAAVLVLALLLPAPRPPGGRRARARAGRRLARSGADVLLVVLAVLAVLRLRSGDGTGPVAGLGAVAGVAGGDPVRVLAPVLALVAGSVLALRLVPPAARAGERWAARSRGFVLPLAALEAARRPRSATALLLLVLATATATSGVAWAATWDRSAGAQAAARVPAAATAVDVPGQLLGQGAAVRAADPAALPVTDRVTGLGTLVTGEDAIRLVGVDTRAALTADLLPGGADWAAPLTALAPDAADPPVLPARIEDDGGVALRVSGSTDAPVALHATATLVLDDGHGARVAAPADEVPLDGAAHDVRAAVPGGTAGPARVVAVLVTLASPDLAGLDAGRTADVAVSVGWSAPDAERTGAGADGADAADAAAWTAAVPAPPTGEPATVLDPTLVPDPAGADGGVGLLLTAEVDVPYLTLRPADVLLAGFAVPEVLPVAVGAGLAADARLTTGDDLDVLVGRTTVPARVVGVLPYVPGAPDGPAVLVDLDALSRAALAAGETATLVDGWWLGSSDGAAPLRAAGADVTVRTEVATALRDGPLRVGVLAALGLLVVGAVALALVGSALHGAQTADDRGQEVARLLALGASPRSVAATHLTQHVAVDLLAVAAGTAVGAVVARVLTPALTVSESGAVAVPRALAVWPWGAEATLLAVVLLGSTVVVVPVLRGLVRRATAAHLRLGDAE